MEILRSLFGGQDAIGLGVNVAILLLFVVGVLDVLAGRSKLTGERNLIKAGRAKLRNQNPEDYNTMCPADSAEAVLRFLHVPENTLVGHRVGTVMKLRLAGQSDRTVLQQLTTERLGGYGSMARQIGANLTLLGLIGTVVGLSLALVNIGDASAGVTGLEGLNRLSRALAGTLGGMKTAFICTLVGLATAVLLSFLNHALKRQQSVLFTEIEEFIVCDLLQAVSSVDPDSESASRSFAGVLSQAAGQLETATTNAMMAAETYENSAKTIESTVSALSSAVERFTSVLESVGGTRAEFTRVMSETGDALHSMRGAVELSSNLLRDDVKTMSAKASSLEAIQTSIQAYHEDFKRFMTDAAKIHAGENRAIADEVLNRHLDGLKSLVSDHKAVMQTVSDMVLDVQLNGRARAAAAHGGQA